MNAADLQKEKIRIRLMDPDRANVIEMILDSAKKAAKEAQREVTEEDLLSSVKKGIKENEKAISLIESKNGDASKWKTELSLLKTFLPVQMTESQVEVELNKILADMPEADRVKKNQGKIMAQMKKFNNVDMAMVSKILNTLLK